jgi:uncharacterized membrane protein (DUF106 family)
VVSPAIGMLIACAILALISKILQRKFIDKREMDYNKEKMKDYQKKMNELTKKGDGEQNRKELEKLQTEMLELNSKMLNSSMKLMWVTMPVFLVAFAILSYLYGGKTLESFIALPTFNGFNMLNPFTWIPTGLSVQTGFFKMYFFYYLGCSLTINFIEGIYDKQIKGKIKK